jgi:hypothetical protein
VVAKRPFLLLFATFALFAVPRLSLQTVSWQMKLAFPVGANNRADYANAVGILRQTGKVDNVCW